MKGKTPHIKTDRNIKKEGICENEFCESLGGYYSDGKSFCFVHFMLYEKSKEGEDGN